MARTAVVLVNYKGAVDTRNCLESLRTLRDVPEIVVVDNTPDDKELLSMVDLFPEVKFISANENLGFGAGNNIGINWIVENKECEFIFILNNDTIIKEDTIFILENALDRYSDVGMVAPRIVFKDEPQMLWYGGGEVSWLRGSAITPGYMGRFDSKTALKARVIGFATGCAMFFRRSVIEKLGGFDDRFFMYEEDVELCLRVVESGWMIRYEPKALVMHVVQASSRLGQGFVDMLSPLNKNLSFYVFHVVRNRLINMHIHASGFKKVVFIFGFSLFLTKKIMKFIIFRRWDGVASVFKGWLSYRKCFGLYVPNINL
jgi:GT2 family glycosyltransferase